MRRLHVMALAAAVLACAAGARAAGTITTAGATLTIGAGTPKGTLTVAPDLPAGVAPVIPPVGTLGTIGTYSSQMPAFPGGGTGADGAFTASGAVINPGSVSNYSTYTVDLGATVTYSSSVVIKTTGAVAINGTVTTSAPNVSVTFLCAADFTMGAAAKVQTTGTSGAILLDVGGAFTAANDGAQVFAGGDCEIRAHGGHLDLTTSKVRALAGDLTLRGSGSVLSASNFFVGELTAGGDLLVQAFGGDASFTVIGNGTAVAVAGPGSVRIEGQNVTVTGNLDLISETGPVSVSAFGGSSTLRCREHSGGDTTVRASANVQMTGGYLTADGAMTLTAFGGDATIAPLGGGDAAKSYGNLTIEASHDVLLNGGGTFGSIGGSVLYRALGDKVLIDHAAVFMGTGGLVDIRGANRVVLGTGANMVLSLRITAGAGGFTGGLGGFTANGPGGGIEITTLGPISVGGQLYTYDGEIKLTSCDAGITLPGGSLRTDGGDSNPSHSVTVQSFADTAGVIDLTGGTIETGDSDVKGGDIRLRVYQGKIPGGGSGETVDAYLLVSKWTTTVNTKKPDKSKLAISGIVDLGTTTPDLHASSDFDVGALNFDLSSPVTKGKKLVAKGEGAVLTLTPNAKGGSRVPFSLTWTGDLSGAFALDGEISPRLRIGGLDTKGTIVLSGGKFALSKAAGRLIVPCVFPQSVAGGLKGGGRDTLSLSIGFATGGTAPVGVDPRFKVWFGGTLSVEVPAASFGPKTGEKFTFKGNVGGITNVTVDHAKGVVTVKGKGLDLGAFADGANAVTIKLEFGGATRTLAVGAVRTGTKLAY